MPLSYERKSEGESRPHYLKSVDLTGNHGSRDDDDPLQAKTNEVTDALRRTVGTMRAELERSVQVTQMLGRSPRIIKNQQDDH
jgi:hypothetical protein